MKIRIIYITLFAVLNLLLTITQVSAQQKDFGVRVGTNQSRRDVTKLHFFEVYYITKPPFIFSGNGSSFPLMFRLNISIGLLYDDSTNSMLISAGPILELNPFTDKILFTAGINPSIMTNHSFSNLELGGSFNFISHIALMVKPFSKIGIAYRFEHISNASLYETNPGVNIHFLEIHYIR
ncbi:acyloxyacyl hydrolase [Melioribacteraceae bacterium 4301-Me]|uniref:acyloxyacyl hydrolase n=1 Tax=Pyranulibacter aquaticus TaxID=3163344 RepID=UPI00359ACF6D